MKKFLITTETYEFIRVSKVRPDDVPSDLRSQDFYQAGPEMAVQISAATTLNSKGKKIINDNSDK